MASRDPFADSHASHLDDNPFNRTIASDSDDPFADPSKSQQSFYPTSTQQSASGSQAKELADRAQELDRREAELNRRATVLDERARTGKNNWPFFYPLIFHDIDVEIPEVHRATVRTLYRAWLLLPIVLIINMVGTVFLLISGQPDGGKDLGAGIMYVPVITLTSFLLWYRPIYNGYMKETALYYYLYFLFCGFHIAFCTYMFIGIPSTGSAGLINTIHAFATASIVTGVFGVLATVGWALEGLANLWLYRMIWSHKNDAGHTWGAAQGQLSAHGAKAIFSRSAF